MKIWEVQKINEEKGHYFFSKDTMNFFSSRIETKGDLIGDKFFVTSEQFKPSPGIDGTIDGSFPRKFSVREFNKESGDIHTVGEFQEFSTKKAAEAFAGCMIDHDLEYCKKLMGKEK